MELKKLDTKRMIVIVLLVNNSTTHIIYLLYLFGGSCGSVAHLLGCLFSVICLTAAHLIRPFRLGRETQWKLLHQKEPQNPHFVY